ncbi:MAG: dihydrofolate reductase [Patescibacteria group bacterium]|nr:dihydrofolate reductase [Patescibacteria group bacterium]
MAQEAEKISVIAAIGKNRAIGKDNQLLWQIPGDLPRFKSLTLGHPAIMGRRTWESIPEKFRPLPGRTNIVITRDSSYDAPGASLAQSFPEALSLARDAEGSEEIFAIGGQQVYECALPFATNLYLTLVDEEKDGDAFFPAYEDQFAKETAREEQEQDGLRYTWLDLERS